jgi:MSHA biogenesis protein MshI
MGVERQGVDSLESFAIRLQALRLDGHQVSVMLRPDQYQLFQIETPAVPVDELRSAARYQIREMLDSALDDVVIDVMGVGRTPQKGATHLFVVAATKVVVKEVLDLGRAMRWTVSVIDIQEAAQRNLQSALAAGPRAKDLANTALLVLDGHKAVLTISAEQDLCYSRRFDLPAGFLTSSWLEEAVAPDRVVAAPVDFEPGPEFVPDYNVDGVSYGTDYSNMSVGPQVQVSTDANARYLENARRLAAEVQRSLDVWSRSWSSLSIDRIYVFAGKRSVSFAQWMSQELGQTITPVNISDLFPELDAMNSEDKAFCLPLLGVLMRA